MGGKFKKRSAARTLHTLYSIPHTRESKGFTLLLAALVASIVLSIGAAIFSIALKQVSLASTGKNSQFAFYAADSGAECALYWDIRNNGFASSSISSVPGTVTCSGPEPITVNLYSSSGSSATSTIFFAVNHDDGTAYCVGVTVAKYLNSSTNGISTTIHADGYSTRVFGDYDDMHDDCTPSGTAPGTAPSAVLSDPNALQRSVELHY